MTEPATSTVAMSIYNWLACQDAARSAAETLAALQACWYRTLSAESFDKAVGELQQRGLITNSRDGLDLVDKRRLLVISRDRTGDGWKSWRFGRPL